MRTGTANSPLHGGNAPAWLFKRMTSLSREIISLIAVEFGTGEVLAKLSDPYWFGEIEKVDALRRLNKFYDF